MYGKDDTQIMVYNMKMWPRERRGEKNTKKGLGSKLLNTSNFAH